MNNRNYKKLLNQIGGTKITNKENKFTKSILNEIMAMKSLEQINSELEKINKDINILLKSKR